MPLHPQCRAFLDQLAALGGPQLHEMTVEQARARSLADFGVGFEPVAQVVDRTVPGPAGPIPVRVYHPAPGETLPAMVYFHGGGWVIGNLDSHDRECRTLANQARCAIVAVDYRLAPEHKFPAAVDDAYAATKFVAENATELGIDASQIAVGGDSAGGTLATVTAMIAQERGGPRLLYQVLVYPVVDLNAKTASRTEFAEGYFLSLAGMDWFTNLYLARPEDALHPYASPMHGDASGLPPALVLTAECDPLRDEGEAYARKLEAAGTPVRYRCCAGMFHPFFVLGGVIDGAREAHATVAKELRAAFSSAAASAR
jgi:acetyl esterase